MTHSQYVVDEDNIWKDVEKLDIVICKTGAKVTDNSSLPFIPFDPNLQKHPIEPIKIAHDVPDMK